MKRFLKSCLHRHSKCSVPSVILFASPRGGSTWVTELVASQPGFWPISEPLNVRSDWVRDQLGLTSFADLYSKQNIPKVLNFYSQLLDGTLVDLKLRPGLKFYRPFTNRIVVKENQACLDRMAWFEDTFGVKIVHLLRHPIPVALSREVFPLLDTFKNCELRAHFSDVELQLADRLIESGSHLEKGVLAWCLHHAPALRNERNSWLRVYYEETVLRPERIIDQLADHLALPDRGRMLKQIVEPSQVTRKSDSETQKLLSDQQNREYLIHKWESRVNQKELQQVGTILETFDISAYSAFSPTPLSRPLSND